MIDNIFQWNPEDPYLLLRDRSSPAESTVANAARAMATATSQASKIIKAVAKASRVIDGEDRW